MYIIVDMKCKLLDSGHLSKFQDYMIKQKKKVAG